jgi:hypothetical protein
VYELHRVALKFPKISSYFGVRNIDENYPKIKFFLILHGYGHEPKNFAEHKNALTQMLRLSDENEKKTDLRLSKIRRNKEKLIAIHIRRGDSVIAGNFSNVLPVNYYKECISRFNKKQTLFLVFSDDIEWCRKHFKGNSFYFVNEQDPVISLNLASKCDGFILSASSFSWWMAWMSRSFDSYVYFPLETHFRGTVLGKAFEANDWMGIDTMFETQN